MTSETPMVPHSLSINGINLHLATWGQFSRTERAVLLVHGLTHNHLIWSALGPMLAERGWYAIAPDLRGRGWSDKPPHGVGIPYHVNDLLALCDALGLSRVHYIGHSLGAMIGYFFAALYPHRLDHFVAVDAGVRASPDVLDIIGPVLARLGQTYPSLEAYMQHIQQATSQIHPWNDFWETFHRSEAEVRRDGTVTLRASKMAIEEELAVNFAINNDILLPVIKAPTLIVQAGQGTYKPEWFILPSDEAARVQSLIKGSHLVVIPDGNHYTLILSEVFTHEVFHFLQNT